MTKGHNETNKQTNKTKLKQKQKQKQKQKTKKKKKHKYCKCVLLNKGVLFRLKRWVPLGVMCHKGAVISSLAMMLISWFQPFPIAFGYLPVRHCPTASRVAASTPSRRLRQLTTNPTTTFTQSPPRWKEPLLPT